jgi:prepilin-type processing-associated H-X9-DG protein
MTAKASAVIPLDRPNTSGGWIDGGTSRRLAKAFRCPSVPPDFRQQCTYANNPVIMPHLPDELKVSATLPKMTAPMTLSQVYSHNALFWDTYANHDMSENAPFGPWWSKGSGGANIPMSMIDDRKPAMATDDGSLDHPQIPERRFRGPTGDRFAGNPDQTLDPNGPIAMANDRWLSDLGFPYSINTDYASQTEWNSGNSRFRHNGNTACNVAFVDGTVRTFFMNAKKGVNGPGVSGTHLFLDNDFKRYYLMPKWLPKFKDTGYNG